MACSLTSGNKLIRDYVSFQDGRALGMIVPPLEHRISLRNELKKITNDWRIYRGPNLCYRVLLRSSLNIKLHLTGYRCSPHSRKKTGSWIFNGFCMRCHGTLAGMLQRCKGFREDWEIEGHTSSKKPHLISHTPRRVHKLLVWHQKQACDIEVRKVMGNCYMHSTAGLYTCCGVSALHWLL